MQNWRIFILGLTLYANSVSAIPQVVDAIAAIVETSLVLDSDIQSMLRMVKYNTQEINQKLPDDTLLRRQILDRLIIDSIILQLARRAHVTISDKQVDQTIGNIAAENHTPLDQLHHQQTYESMNYNTYRAQIRNEMLIAAVRNAEVFRRITILPQEVDALAQQIEVETGNNSTEFNLSHILIPLPENPRQDQLKKVEALAHTLIEQYKKDNDLERLVITYSNNPLGPKGSQMGWRALEELPSFFAIRLKRTQKGNLVGPIRSSIGLHILKVNDIRNSNQKVAVTELRARHILLKTSGFINDQQARTKLENIAAQIKSGNISFNIAAKQFSDDNSSVNQGGDLGWNSTNAFDPTFRNTLMHLKKWEISKPVHSSFGWHLIQLIETRQVYRTDYTQKERAYRLLFKRKFAEEAETWMQEQRASAYVKILENNG